MLDGVVHVVRRDVDREPDRVVLELFDGGRHPAIQAEGVRPRVEARDELGDPPLDLVADRAHPLERPADRILDPPVDVGRPRENRADVAAAHGHDHVRPGRVCVGIELSRAAAREVDPELAHRLHHLRMELVTGMAPGGAHLVTAGALEERVRHLRATLVSDAEEEDVHGRRLGPCDSSSSSATASRS